MKKLLLLFTLIFSATAMAADGGALVSFTNKSTNDTVQFIVTVNSTTIYTTSQLSPKSGTSTTLDSNAFGSANTFNVSIIDISSGKTTPQNCLTYLPKGVALSIYGVCNPPAACTCFGHYGA